MKILMFFQPVLLLSLVFDIWPWLKFPSTQQNAKLLGFLKVLFKIFPMDNPNL